MIKLALVYLLVIILWVILIFRNSIKHNNPITTTLLWKKFATYLPITFLIFLLIGVYKPLLYLIPTIGLFEIYSTYKKSHIQPIAFIILSTIFYLLICYYFCLFIHTSTTSNLVSIYMIVAVFDANSQLFGMLYGKIKILPTISPNKTLEGSIGGVISVIILSGILSSFSMQTFYTAIILTSGAFIGDMLASIYKRKIKIKDFSNFIPSHGGILDRFDSFIFAGAA